MNNQRVTPNSKRGRQLNRIARETDRPSPEISAWNKAVEEKKKAKQVKKQCPTS